MGMKNKGCGCCGGTPPDPDTVSACSCGTVPKSLNVSISNHPNNTAFANSQRWWGSGPMSYYDSQPSYLVFPFNGQTAYEGAGWYSPILTGLGPSYKYIWAMRCLGGEFQFWIRTRDENNGWAQKPDTQSFAIKYRTVAYMSVVGSGKTAGASCSPFAIPNVVGGTINSYYDASANQNRDIGYIIGIS